MNYITCLLTIGQNHYVFGTDAQGILYAWNLKKVFHEHITRCEETRKNNNVYTYVCRWKICQAEIKHLLVFANFLLVSTNTQIFKIPFNVLFSFLNEYEENSHRNPNLVDITDTVQLNVITRLDSFRSDNFGINSLILKDQILYIGSECGRVIVLEADREDVLQIIDTNKIVSDCVQNMVPLQRNPITALTLFNQNELLIGSQLGVLMIWSLQKNEIIQTLRFPNKTQTLSPVLQTHYDKDTCQLVTLHEEYICFWNIVINELIKIINRNGFTSMIIRNSGVIKIFHKICKDIVLGGESSLLETIRTNENAFELEIQTSQELILGMLQVDQEKSFQEILMVRGDTPFVDVYRNLCYQFTLTCL